MKPQFLIRQYSNRYHVIDAREWATISTHFRHADAVEAMAKLGIIAPLCHTDRPSTATQVGGGRGGYFTHSN